MSSTPGYVYVIRENRTGLYKIGITTNLSRRMQQLGVGKTATQVSSVYTSDAVDMERSLHRKYAANRIPQTEYFQLNGAPSLPSTGPTGPKQTDSDIAKRRFRRALYSYKANIVQLGALVQFQKHLEHLDYADIVALRNALYESPSLDSPESVAADAVSEYLANWVPPADWPAVETRQ